MEKEHNLLIVSDLHLSDGYDPETGRTSRLEDFLFDDAFARFLRYHEEVKEQPRFGGRPWLLIINGDFFDFLQVVSLPEEGESLREIKGVERHKALRGNERDYGLGTTSEESEWKLGQIAKGHQRFFATLGRFLAHGNQIAVVKGNHDVELHWEAVQERFVAEIERAYAQEREELGSGPPIMLEACRERVRFYPWFYHQPGRVYVEHGCQYEAANHFRDFLNPVLPNDPERIELPWGSLFVRYLFNKVEDVHPFADNVKPLTRYLNWAFRKNPVRAIEILVKRGWVFLRAFWKVARKTTTSALRASEGREKDGSPQTAPLPEEITGRIKALARQRVDASWQGWVRSLLQGLLSFLMLFIIIAFVALVVLSFTGVGEPWWKVVLYLGAAILAYFMRHELKRSLSVESRYLLEVASDLERILGREYGVRYVVMGHDHRATIKRMRRAWYVNTGAWVPIYEEDGPIEGREELTFLRLAWEHESTPELLRWDDAAGAPTRVILR